MVPADETDLTGAWLRTLIGDDARFSGVRWTDVDFERIGEGFGLDGMLFRALLPGAATASVVVKTADWSTPTEPYFYRHLAPQIPVRFAECFGSAEADDGERYALVIEDLHGCVQGDCLIGASETQTENLVAATAKIHHRFWGGADPLLYQDRRVQIDAASLSKGFDATIEALVAHYGGDLGPEPAHVYDRLVDRLPWAAEEMQKATPTFIHSDLHLDNVMFDGDEPIILDWPGGRIGPGALDLAGILVEGMILDQRRQRHDHVVAHYLRTLHQAGTEISADALQTQLAAASIFVCRTALAWFASSSEVTAGTRVSALIRNVVVNSFRLAADLCDS